MWGGDENLTDEAFAAKVEALSDADRESIDTIHLWECHLKSPWTTLYKFPNLYFLSLRSNQLDPLPEDLGAKLPWIRDLDVSDCKLTALPDSLVQMKDLWKLSLNDNSIEKWPNLAECKNLRTVHASNNKLTAVPPLPAQLTALDLSDNAITDISSVKKLSELYTLYLADNNDLPDSQQKNIRDDLDAVQDFLKQ